MKTTMTLSKITLFLLLQLWFSFAMAHAFIEEQHPKAGEELNASPKAIVLTYTKDIEPTFSTIKIVQEDSQTPIKTEKAHGVKGKPTKLVLSLPTLPKGDYHVSWVALSRDGHRTMGDYPFSIQ